MTEYVVYWNGVNDGHDGDLLVPDARQHDKRVMMAAPAPRLPFRDALERVRQALPRDVSVARSRDDLVVQTGLSVGQVSAALTRLRHAGVLANERPARRGAWRTSVPQKYWRIA